MLPPHLRPALALFDGRLRAAFGERLKDVVLFGSYARGDAHEDSDVDVLAVIDGLTTSEIAAVSDVATITSLETGVPLASCLKSRGFARAG